MFLSYVDNDYCFWRETYDGDDQYLQKHIPQLSECESATDYQARLQTTPSPTQARGIVNRIRYALQDRLRYAVRYGKLIQSMETGQGVEGTGGSVNQYVSSLAKELLIDGKVGVFFSNTPDIQFASDLQRSRPFCRTVKAADISKIEPAKSGSASPYSLVEFQLCDGDKTTNIRLWTDDAGKVFGKTLPDGDDVDMKTDVIPFVLIKHQSVIGRIARTQKALANLLSVMSSNSPDLVTTFLARQRDVHNVGTSMRSEAKDATVGRQRGIWYEKNLDQPAFVSQPAGPMAEAREVAIALSDEMEYCAGIAGESEAERKQNLAYVVGALADSLLIGEKQIWAQLGRYAGIKEPPIVRYPSTWSAQTEAERLADVGKHFDVAQQFYGRAGTEIGAVYAVEQALAGRSSAEIEAAVNSVKAARCLATDLLTIVRAYEAKGLDTKTVCDAFGCLPVVAEDAKTEAVEKMQQQAQAQATLKGQKESDHTVGSMGSNREGELADKALSQKEGEGDTRGEGK